MTNILLLHGDGIGVEVTAQAERVLEHIATRFNLKLNIHRALIGGCAIDKEGEPLPASTLAVARDAKGILLGAVGGPAWDHLIGEARPEAGLLKLRQSLDLFANLRPARFYSQLQEASPLKPNVADSFDLLVVRELVGGIYFGQPRGLRTLSNNLQEAYNTATYNQQEITRIARLALDLADQRRGLLCSVDKANVLEVSRLWRNTVNELHKKDFSHLQLEHMYVDNAAMQLVLNPAQFDVILSSNLFGDILSDLAGAITGSIGMLPSASLNNEQQGLYEPCHGSAPEIAGKDIANPLAAILSVAMLLRFTLANETAAVAIENAVDEVLASDCRTADIALPNTSSVGTKAMADAVLNVLTSQQL